VVAEAVVEHQVQTPVKQMELVERAEVLLAVTVAEVQAIFLQQALLTLAQVAEVVVGDIQALMHFEQELQDLMELSSLSIQRPQVA
jgi:hypothetical protein